MRFRFSQAAIVLGLVLLFLVANRGAYEGYFSDDDLDNLANTMQPGLDFFVRSFGSVEYDRHNFRPIGHLTYRWMGELWGLKFPPFVALIQLLHFINVFLIFWVARSFLSIRAAAIAALFFAFHPALIAAHWKPMYLFDLLCATALMGAYYLYRRGWWFWSLLLFWCAYKSKEIAILFPLLLLWEEWQGERRWLRAVPFLGISLSFGIQALLANQMRAASPYNLQFTSAAMGECLRFYMRASLGVPWILGVAAAWLTGAERRWLVQSLLAATILLGPLLFLPGRLFAVYLYVPLMFGSLAVGAVLGRSALPVLMLLLVTYVGIGVRELRTFRRVELTQAQATKEFVESACRALNDSPALREASYEGGPPGLNSWGVEAAIRLCDNNLAMKLHRWDLAQLRPGDNVIRWTKMPGKRGRVESVRFDGELSGNWYAWEGSFRWMSDRASIRLKTDSFDRRLAIELAAARATEIEAFADGISLGVRHLQHHGEQVVVFEMPPPTRSHVVIELQTRPIGRMNNDPRDLGVAVRSLGATP